MDGDGAVTLGVGDAGEDESGSHLVVVEEGLLGLVNLSGEDLSSAGGAGTGTARVGELDSGLFGGINDEDIIGTVDGGIDVVFGGGQLDLVSELGGHGSLGHGGESLGGGGGEKNEESLGEHGGGGLGGWF